MAISAPKQLFSVADYHKMTEVGIIKPDARVDGKYLAQEILKATDQAECRTISFGLDLSGLFG